MRQKQQNQSKKTFKEIIFEQRVTIFTLSIIFLGLIFVIISPPLPSAIRDIGISLIPAGIPTAIAELYLRKDFMREFKESQYRYEFFAELEKLGIKRVYESREKEDPIFGEIAQIARNEPQHLKKVQILGISLSPFYNTVGALIDTLLENGCEFQFLSLDADSEVATKRENQEMTGVKDRIRSFEKWIKEYMKKGTFKGRIEFRKYNFMPTFHITILNEERLFINPYPIFGSGWSLPVLEIDKNGALFKIFKQQFEKAWSKAVPLE